MPTLEGGAKIASYDLRFLLLGVADTEDIRVTEDVRSFHDKRP